MYEDDDNDDIHDCKYQTDKHTGNGIRTYHMDKHTLK